LFGDYSNRELAEALLEDYYLEDILNEAGMSEEDALTALLDAGLIRVPQEMIPAR